jgi:hypothetical protein
MVGMPWHTYGDGDGDGETGMGWPSGTEGGTSERASGAQMQVPYVPGRIDAKSRALPFFLRTDVFQGLTTAIAVAAASKPQPQPQPQPRLRLRLRLRRCCVVSCRIS